MINSQIVNEQHPLMRIYLDTCVYHRKFDDQRIPTIREDTDAVETIFERIKQDELVLVSSFVSVYENSKCSDMVARNWTESFMKNYSSIYVNHKSLHRIEEMSKPIIESGVKDMDSLHIACAIYSECDYLVTVDKRMMHFYSDIINIISPIELIETLEVEL